MVDEEAQRVARESIALIRSSLNKVDLMLGELADAIAAKGVTGVAASPMLLAELQTVGTELSDLSNHLARSIPG